jgi:Arc/MetJ-type ribon-helix-helix transcriptional regulator
MDDIRLPRHVIDRLESRWVEKEYSWRSVFIREGMNNERKSSKAEERAAEGLREATAEDEAKNESKTGHDLAKGADRFEERSKAPMEEAHKKNRKGDYTVDPARCFRASRG